MAFGDSSTGVLNDVASVCRLAGERGVLVFADGVSALGGTPFLFDEWGVDVAVTASQKCLMSGPGLSFAALSPRAWAAVERARLPRNYWSFTAIRDEISRPRPETPGTPPVQLVLQVAEALRMIHEEGLDHVYRRHAAMAARVRTRIASLGLPEQCPDLRTHSPALTAIALPPHVPPPAVRDGLRARGILTAAGLGPFRAAGFRIGHMGDIRLADVDRTLDALRDVMAELRVRPVAASA
jgi:alanine-glyoxylate transaminase/serine-glyoxylate transaminase/serine-pyruvate transaminase